MKKILVFLSLLAPVTSANAGPMRWTELDGIQGVALTTACVANPGLVNDPGCPSAILKTTHYDNFCLIFQYTWSDATQIRVYKDDGVTNGGVIWGSLQLGAANPSGQVMMNAQFARWNVSASSTWSFCYEITAPWTRIRVESIGGDADDKITKAWAVLSHE